MKGVEAKEVSCLHGVADGADCNLNVFAVLSGAGCYIPCPSCGAQVWCPEGDAVATCPRCDAALIAREAA